MPKVNVTEPNNTKVDAQKQLQELRKHCKINDVISPIVEDWSVDLNQTG